MGSLRRNLPNQGTIAAIGDHAKLTAKIGRFARHFCEGKTLEFPYIAVASQMLGVLQKSAFCGPLCYFSVPLSRTGQLWFAPKPMDGLVVSLQPGSANCESNATPVREIVTQSGNCAIEKCLDFNAQEANKLRLSDNYGPRAITVSLLLKPVIQRGLANSGHFIHTCSNRTA